MKNILVPQAAFAQRLAPETRRGINKCIQCGHCTACCPSGKFVPMVVHRLLRAAQVGFPQLVLPQAELWHCTTCFRCVERCPRGLAIPELLIGLRNLAVRDGYLHPAHHKVADKLLSTGHLVPAGPELKKNRQALGLEPLPPTTATFDKALSEVRELCDRCGFTQLLKVVEQDNWEHEESEK